MKDSLTRDQFRLYQLVWKRFVASRMQPAKYETTSVRIAAGEYRFTVAASRIAFEGFRCVYTEADEEKEENNVLVKGLDENAKLPKKALRTKQHFYTAAGSLYRGRAGQNLRGAWDRTSQYLCADDHHDHFQKICGEGK